MWEEALTKVPETIVILETRLGFCFIQNANCFLFINNDKLINIKIKKDFMLNSFYHLKF